LATDTLSGDALQSVHIGLEKLFGAILDEAGVPSAPEHDPPPMWVSIGGLTVRPLNALLLEDVAAFDAPCIPMCRRLDVRRQGDIVGPLEVSKLEQYDSNDGTFTTYVASDTGTARRVAVWEMAFLETMAEPGRAAS
jgi:hypothetical protein